MTPPTPPALLRKLRAVSAEQLERIAPNAPIPSPCIAVCRMDDARQYCVGCLRTLDELCAWSHADPATQRTIWQRVRERANHTE